MMVSYIMPDAKPRPKCIRREIDSGDISRTDGFIIMCKNSPRVESRVLYRYFHFRREIITKTRLKGLN